MKVTKEQLDTIRNAKTDPEAWEAFKLIDNHAFDKYSEIREEAHKKYKAVIDPAWDKYEKVYTRCRKAFDERDRKETYETNNRTS